MSRAGWSASLPEHTVNPVAVEMLARAFASGELTVEAVCKRAAEVLGREWRWMRGLARRYVAAHGEGVRPRERDALSFLKRDKRFKKACARYREELRVQRWIVGEMSMQPVAAAAGWAVPRLETERQLETWLGLTTGELEWFADLKMLQRRTGCARELRHYDYRWMEKRTGGLRLVESPKERMKRLQWQILREVLERVPPHDSAHGFVKGRSIKTFAEAHAGRLVVLRMDLKNFFPGVRRARVQSVFRMLGYPERVADLLGGLCTTATPRDVWREVGREEMRRVYGQSHLPQGAPTSPALGNICCYRLDCRLAGLAKAAGGHYTRYADDLAFSGGEKFARGLDSFVARVGAMVLEQGMELNYRKTRTMRRGVRQQLAGLVVNEGVHVRRAEFDRLKAILTNCARNGPEQENREGRAAFREHLEGRVSFVSMIEPARGVRLRALLDRVDWG